ncbi:MAG TPA: ThuA domain-containing protein [Caulobacterales bacterium]|nr:ThuA domain-containing protein [Caulobacterales bacterium]
MRGIATWLALLASLALAACATVGAHAQPHVLIFSYSTGYRHASIEPGVAALKAMGERDGYVMDASEDPDMFLPGRLDGYDAIIFLSSSSQKTDPNTDWLVGARREGLQAFVHRGGGVVGIHAASDSNYHWMWYRQMIGAAFDHHPPGTPTAVVTFVDRNDPSTRGLPATVTRTDEWYHFFDIDPRIHVIATYDPQSYGEDEANPHPISWRHEFEGGRIFYTGMGHTTETYSEDVFIRHVEGGLKWALRKAN